MNVRKIPRAPRYRPDFMKPSASTPVEEGIRRPEGELPAGPDDPQKYHYYRSDRILGKLYRAVDEDEFFEELRGDEKSLFGREGDDDVLTRTWRFVTERVGDAGGAGWREFLAEAAEIKER